MSNIIITAINTLIRLLATGEATVQTVEPFHPMEVEFDTVASVDGVVVVRCNRAGLDTLLEWNASMWDAASLDDDAYDARLEELTRNDVYFTAFEDWAIDGPVAASYWFRPLA